MWAAEELVIDRGIWREPDPSLEAVLMFSFLIVRGVGLPRACSVRRNLFGRAGLVDVRVQAFAAI
jgi:hypothetical protein